MIKKSLLSIVIFLLCTYFAFGQSNNPPLIYRISNDTVQFIGTGRVVINDALKSTQIREIPLPIVSLSLELNHHKTKAYVAARIPIGSTGLGAVLVNFNENDSNPVLPFLQGKVVYRLKLAPNPDGLLWALLGDDNQVLLLDPDRLKIIGKIDNVERPVDIVFSPDGTKVYVALFNNNVLVFDTKTQALIKTITGLPPNSTILEKAGEMAISSDGNILAIGSKNLVSFIDTSSYTIADPLTIPIEFSRLIDKTRLKLLFHPNGNIIYIAESSRLYSYEIHTKKLTQIFNTENIDLGNFIQDLTITPDGRLLYVSDFGSRIVVDTKNESIIFIGLDSGFNRQNFQGIALTGDFTVGQAPTLQTTSPITSQQVMANRPFTITWQTTVQPQSFSLASYKIEVSTDGGATFNVIPGAEQLKPEAQSFTWNVPDIEVAKAQIRVSTVDLGARMASSTTGNFSISKNGGSTGDTQLPTVSFISPKGGEKFNSGDSLQISWTSSDNVGVTSQDLSLSTDGGATFPITLASGLSGATQNFTYQIPMSLQSDQTKLRLVVRDGAGNNAQAVTANNFTISLGADTIVPTVTISEPNPSQSIVAGQPIQVKWQSTDNRAVVSQALLLSFDGGKTFSQISSFGATDNSFVLSNLDKLNFTTPQTMVKITAKDSTGNQGEANSLFTIAPAITMASYQTKVLLINGIGFMSNVNNIIKLFINDREVTLSPNSVNNSSFMIKGNKKKLNIIKGNNKVKLVVDGVGSNSFSFQF